MEQYKIVDDAKTRYPMGVTRLEDKLHLSVAARGEQVFLVLYRAGETEPCERIKFSSEMRIGDVWNLTLEGGNWDHLEYQLEVDGELKADPYGTGFTGREHWGDLEQAVQVPRCRLAEPEFDWEQDRPPELPFEELILYRIHVRGLTEHPSSRVRHKGTFRGVAEKIPYMKELGATGVEMMPPVEFQEVEIPKADSRNPYQKETGRKPEPTGKLNYWGYAPSYYFAPKAAFGSGRTAVETEIKQLVKELHKNGMELVIELYFSGEESAAFVLDVLRFWVREYHVDGIHLVGHGDWAAAASDPYLSRTKLFATAWGDVPGETNRHLGEYNDGFLVDMRRLLKGDEDQLNALIFRNRRNPKSCGVINYMAHTNGFTMMDMVSYDRKHNEDNGEDNRDGTDYNYSWNCGAEGPSRKRKVKADRRRQIRNALVLLFLSQGTPLLLAGDEFGNTKKGNNNSYCQDNEISWLNWNQLKTNRDIYEFARFMIQLRKDHPVFRMPQEPVNTDYLACGLPDLSYHGVNAWKPEFENYRRQLGMLYCGAYGKRVDGRKDDDFYVIYNMHWEPHEFALPRAKKPKKWRLCADTAADERNGMYPPGEEPLLEDQKQLTAAPRSIVILTARE